MNLQCERCSVSAVIYTWSGLIAILEIDVEFIISICYY